MNAGNIENRIDIGAEVIGSDGQHAGKVNHVVVQPDRMQITHVVIGTGAILGRDIVVPVDVVDHIADRKLFLTLDRGELERCPNFVEVEYQQPPDGWVPPVGPYYPPGAMLWPQGTVYDYPQPSSITVNTPAGSIALYHGMEVVSSDGHKVGSIDAVDANSDTEDITDIVMKQGFLFTHDVRIPVDAIAAVEGDKVRLNLTRDEVQRRFHPEPEGNADAPPLV